MIQNMFSVEWRKKVKQAILHAIPMIIGISVIGGLIYAVIYMFRLWVTLTHL